MTTLPLAPRDGWRGPQILKVPRAKWPQNQNFYGKVKKCCLPLILVIVIQVSWTSLQNDPNPMVGGGLFWSISGPGIFSCGLVLHARICYYFWQKNLFDPSYQGVQIFNLTLFVQQNHNMAISHIFDL